MISLQDRLKFGLMPFTEPEFRLISRSLDVYLSTYKRLLNDCLFPFPDTAQHQINEIEYLIRLVDGYVKLFDI